jgi:hypothetical protein
LLESAWSRTDSTTEAIAESIRTITRATANSKRNVTHHIPQNASSKKAHKTQVTYWNLVGTCVLLEPSWSRTDSTTDSTTEAIANGISTIRRATANSKRNIHNRFHKLPLPNNCIQHKFPIGNSLETVFCLEAVGQQHIPQHIPQSKPQQIAFVGSQ